MTTREFAGMVHNGERNRRYGSIAKFWQQRLIAAPPEERRRLAQNMNEEAVRRLPRPLCGASTEGTDLVVFADGSGLMVAPLGEHGDLHLIAIHKVISVD